MSNSDHRLRPPGRLIGLTVAGQLFQESVYSRSVNDEWRFSLTRLSEPVDRGR